MKFSNGHWLLKEGHECFGAQEVYFTKIEEKKVTICAPTHQISNRGDTLGGVNLTLVITSPAPEIIRLQTYHYLGSLRKGPDFDLNLKETIPLKVTETEELISIQSGTLTLEITKKSFSMIYKRDGKAISKSKTKGLALMKTCWRGHAYDKGDTEDTYMRQELSISIGELFYGLGERFSPFVKNGQSIEIWNEDGGTSTEQSYKNIPFVLSNKGYGIFVNHTEKVHFEIATEKVTKIAFGVTGGYLDYYLINGPTLKDTLVHFTDLTGKPGLPAPWTFGLWLSTSFTTNYDEKTVMSFIDGMLDRRIPLRTFHFDCFWMKEFHWSDFLWDERVFPDPAGMLKRIKEKGLNICVWINSYIGQESLLFEEGAKKGFFLKRTNGDVWQWDMWQPGMAIVDFTNPQACLWFQEKLEKLLDIGVDCFKTDFGERIPVEDVVWFDGSDPRKMHNYYTLLYNKCVFELLERKRGKGEAVLFARSATIGGQKYPVHWGGDCWSDYESMEESLRGGLSLLMSGFGFWAHDIGGFESTSTADVYKRWVAFGLLSSHSRLHGSSSYRVPWTYDEEAVDVLRFFTNLKASFMPYLFSVAVEASKSGIPTMRAMVLEFENDKNVMNINTQYMLGPSLLVAPIFNDEGLAEFYLPKGKWTNYFTGEVKEGPFWISGEKYNYLSIPLFVRENSIVIVGSNNSRPDYDYADGCEVKIYQLIESVESKATVYDMKKNVDLEIAAKKENGKIKISSKSSKPYSIRLVNTEVSAVTGGSDKIDGKDTIIMPEKSEIEVTLK